MMGSLNNRDTFNYNILGGYKKRKGSQIKKVFAFGERREVMIAMGSYNRFRVVCYSLFLI